MKEGKEQLIGNDGKAGQGDREDKAEERNKG